MTVPAFDAGNFKALFPEFENQEEGTLSAWWTTGTSYISTNNAGSGWTDAQAQLGNDLMCAHLAKSFAMIAQGQLTVVIQGATEGSVTIAVTPPPVKSAFGYWLSTTPYGAQLRALLGAVSGAGLMIGGSYERGAFRKAGGVF